MRRRLALLSATLLGGLLLTSAPPAEAAHPFYENLLRQGKSSYQQGATEEAVRQLRIAAFGLLEEPPRLAESLVWLALAQAGTGDADGVRATFGRLVEIEERFGAYSAAALSTEIRASFESKVAPLVPATTLAASAAFRPLWLERTVAALEKLPPASRRKELEAWVGREPGEARWRLMLSKLLLDLGEARDAEVHASAALATSPASPQAHCLRGLARAASGSCAGAAEDLGLCPESRSDLGTALALLECQVKLGQAQQAQELLAALPPNLRQERKVNRLARRLPTASPSPQAPPPELPPPATPRHTTPATLEETRIPPEDRSRMVRARALLEQARRPEQLREAYELALEVAGEYPQSREAQVLAGEAAYRSSRWAEAAQLFDRAGYAGDDRPEVLFYMAVAYYEVGRKEDARQALTRALPEIQRSPFVDRYVQRIQGEGSP